jgi:hypothetical protein
VLEVDESVFRPESFLERLACDQLARTRNQNRKHFDWLAVKPHPQAAPVQFPGEEIQLESLEQDAMIRSTIDIHTETLSARKGGGLDTIGSALARTRLDGGSLARFPPRARPKTG